MNALEQYISRATRGLYGAKKLEIQTELRGSLEARIWQLERQGNTNALETALNEMGAAKTINAGLIKEHLMPNISKIAFAAIAATALSITTISSSNAQVGWAVPKIELGQEGRYVMCFCSNLYISLSDLKTMLEKAGATVEESMSQPLSSSTNSELPTWDRQAPVRTLSISFVQAGQNYAIQLQALSEHHSLGKDEKVARTPEEAEFIPFQYVLDQFKTTRLPLRLEGWQRPKIQIGTFSFTLERQGATPNIDTMYQSVFYQWWAFGSGRPGTRNQLAIQPSGTLQNISSTAPERLISVSVLGSEGEHRITVLDPRDLRTLTIGQQPAQFRHAIRTKDPANTVYAIVSSNGGFQTRAGQDEPFTYYSLARTNAQGILEFSAPYRILEFGKDSRLIKATQPQAGSEKQPAQALLFKFTGRLDDAAKPVELVLPSKTKIAAIK
jgi:hypothetical protein